MGNGKKWMKETLQCFFSQQKSAAILSFLQSHVFVASNFCRQRFSARSSASRGEWHITWHVACFVLRVVPLLWVFKHVSFVRSCRVMSDHFELCDIMWFVSVEFDAFDEFEVKMCQNCRDVFPESHSFDSCFFFAFASTLWTTSGSNLQCPERYSFRKELSKRGPLRKRLQLWKSAHSIQGDATGQVTQVVPVSQLTFCWLSRAEARLWDLWDPSFPTSPTHLSS